MYIKTALLAGTLACAQHLTALPAAHADSAELDTHVFRPGDFDQYSPRTAFDMVSRIPGFSIREDNSGDRGLGQAEGNVLINGRRISGKSVTTREALERIPATNVRRRRRDAGRAGPLRPGCECHRPGERRVGHLGLVIPLPRKSAARL